MWSTLLTSNARDNLSPQRRGGADRILVCLYNITLLFLLFVPFSHSGEIYRWKDDKGVIHVTDDRSNIPAKYWEEERVKKEKLQDSSDTNVPMSKPAETPRTETPKEESGSKELFGDYPLEWWVSSFNEIKKNIADTEDKLDRERGFVSVFEGGRSYGKFFSKAEIAQYESYSADIPLSEERLRNLRSELAELQRKAAIYGVPRRVRE